MGAVMPVRFAWRGENIAIRAKVARTEMRSTGGRMVYSTGLQFAPTVDESPEPIRRMMASLVKTSVAEKPAAEVPIFFERAPFFRDEEEEEPAPPAAAPKPSPAPVIAAAIAMPEELPEISGPDFELDLNPSAEGPTHYDFGVEPAVASQSFELEGEDLGMSFEPQPDETPAPASFELHVEEESPRYVRCSFEEGKWSAEQTADAKQPREGFTILDPGDQREIDQFCKTYEYADPETRRMIRVSCELMIAQSH